MRVEKIEKINMESSGENIKRDFDYLIKTINSDIGFKYIISEIYDIFSTDGKFHDLLSFNHDLLLIIRDLTTGFVPAAHNISSGENSKKLVTTNRNTVSKLYKENDHRNIGTDSDLKDLTSSYEYGGPEHPDMFDNDSVEPDAGYIDGNHVPENENFTGIIDAPDSGIITHSITGAGEEGESIIISPGYIMPDESSYDDSEKPGKSAEHPNKEPPEELNLPGTGVKDLFSLGQEIINMNNTLDSWPGPGINESLSHEYVMNKGPNDLHDDPYTVLNQFGEINDTATKNFTGTESSIDTEKPAIKTFKGSINRKKAFALKELHGKIKNRDEPAHSPQTNDFMPELQPRNIIRQKNIDTVDIDTVMERLIKEIERDYIRFYGD